MAWKETCRVTERTQFINAWEAEWNDAEGRVNFAALCRTFGVSRVTGYKWLARYRDGNHSIDALKDRSRRPLSSPSATTDEFVDLVIRARKARPRWGARKLWTWLQRRHGFSARELPAPSTIAAILKRNGLAQVRRKRRRTERFTEPFRDCNEPNAVWCLDFKGHFRTGDGVRCYPLTIMDAFSRKLLRCEGLKETDGATVRDVFESAFREYGLPKALRSDNGPPFASVGPGGLTELSAWWIRLGVHHERIEPGKPQQNGRHERMHLTLKIETALPPAPSFRAQQRRFDQFRKIYNQERPHEALEQKTPDDMYQRSSAVFPEKVLPLQYEFDQEVRRVDRDGTALLNRSRAHVGVALYGENVGFRWVGDRRWEVRFGAVRLGLFDEVSRKLIRPRSAKRGRKPRAEA